MKVFPAGVAGVGKLTAADGRLLVVNSQFNRPTDPVEPFTVSSVPKP